MPTKKLKGNLKENDVLLDDLGLFYKVVGVSSMYAVLEELPNPKNFSCDVMTYDALEREGWTKVHKFF